MNSDFAKELAKGMEDLMKEIGGGEALSGDGNGSTKPEVDDETAKALQAAWEAMLTEDKNGQSAPAAAVEKEKPAGNDFQKTIRDGMERLRQSESQASGSVRAYLVIILSNPQKLNPLLQAPGSGASGIPDQASLEALLSSLGEGESEGELAGFIDHMMNAILTKDILLEPLQEMSQKVCSQTILDIQCLMTIQSVSRIPREPTFPHKRRRSPEISQAAGVCQEDHYHV